MPRAASGKATPIPSCGGSCRTLRSEVKDVKGMKVLERGCLMYENSLSIDDQLAGIAGGFQKAAQVADRRRT